MFTYVVDLNPAAVFATQKGELPPGRTAVSSSSGGFPFRDMEIETELNELWRKAKEY
ncbi:hypothetical protein Syun_011289 [Stephania yunnanensis]|uniref:Uncharacterized protein n=1 Tax=Stephania yunnanensis TaxID=152371 RepID=A0AAP0JXZ6_9MAGN